jgi:hypothetical protein
MYFSGIYGMFGLQAGNRSTADVLHPHDIAGAQGTFYALSLFLKYFGPMRVRLRDNDREEPPEFGPGELLKRVGHAGKDKNDAAILMPSVSYPNRKDRSADGRKLTNMAKSWKFSQK